MTSLVRPPKRLTDKEAAELLEAYEAGGTVKGLARELELHHTTVRRLLDEAGVVRRRVVPLTDDELVVARGLYESGLSIMQVAKQFDQKYQSMRQALLRAGVQMRPPVAER